MSQIEQLATPAFLLAIDTAEHNIARMAVVCADSGKELCPMVKTHKSVQLAALQAASGVDGFLVGTLDEAELLVSAGYTKIVLAYPIAAVANINRVVNLAKNSRLVLSLDGLAAAQAIEAVLAPLELTLDYLLIIDCGLGRFGVKPQQAATLMNQLQALDHLRFTGISTHPGQVYAQHDHSGVQAVAAAEIAALEVAAAALTAAGFKPTTVATGSTPTAAIAAHSSVITTLRPGNYVFNDAIQVALGVSTINDCALTVLATVISNPQPGLFLIDAGSKCFGLDKGAHGTALLSGYGIIKNHPELTLVGLSEEVGKIEATAPTAIAVGDKLEIIPNHACAAANMTSFLICHRQGTIDGQITIAARSGLYCRI